MIAKYLFVAIGCFCLASCTKMPETHYYTLEWQHLSQPVSSSGRVLHIQDFDAAPMLKYDKMMYRTSLYEVKYDNFRRWVMTPGSLLTHKAAHYFERSGLFDAVVLDVPRGMDSFSLFGRVNHFEEMSYENEHKAFISVTFELTNFDARKPLLTITIDKEMPIAGGTVEDIVAAMSETTRLVFDDLTQAMLPLLK
ncbi:membrane integrity-associated transporter subunit PqiC [candidate division KSB1 bacterium]|nr:membrane integrity-associated transporter subunit PqiC [candidate division KSB1 bacterium]